ncbi:MULTISPECIES: hydrogenase maturation protease [unclassified Frankia]
MFLGDDGFGVEVVRRIDPADLPAGVDVVDYGIRGVHLAYELLDGRYDVVILVDAVSSTDPPGTLTVLRPELDGAGVDDIPVDEIPVMDAHGMSPDVVLRLLRGLGGDVGRVLVVGCRPAVVEERMGLSRAAGMAVDDAVRLIAQIIRDPGPWDPSPASASRRERPR